MTNNKIIDDFISDNTKKSIIENSDLSINMSRNKTGEIRYIHDNKDNRINYLYGFIDILESNDHKYFSINNFNGFLFTDNGFIVGNNYNMIFTKESGGYYTNEKDKKFFQI